MNSQELSVYKRDGYFVAKNLFSVEECAIFKKQLLDQVEKGIEALKKDQATGPKNVNRDTIADVPRAINRGMLQDIAHRAPHFMAIAKDPRMVKIASAIVGPDISMYRSLSVFKPKGNGREVGWHQDMRYWKGQNNKVSAWISLDRVTKERGAMHFIPGSHHHLIDEVIQQDEVFSLVVPAKYIDESKALTEETNIGDVVFFDSQVLHGSAANTTGEDRYSLVFTYQPASDLSHHREGLPELIAGQYPNLKQTGVENGKTI